MQEDLADLELLINGFIKEHVTGQGRDHRTEKAYRLDLEHFYEWMKQRETPDRNQNIREGFGDETLEDWMERYLDYLSGERQLSASTISRKNRVFGYFLSYLTNHSMIAGYRLPKPEIISDRKVRNREKLSKRESEAFFAAMGKEYESLDSEFRKRVCLRDMVMMKLLFYHKIEISELLRLEISDYDKQTDILTIRRKRGENGQFYLYSQELRCNMEEWLRERVWFRREGEYYDRMFVSKLGKPLSMKMVIKVFEKYRKLAGIEKEFTPKDLKESCMKQYAKELVMERCG